jgi:hypothetical protein
MALESDQVTAVAVEASEFPDLVREYRVTGVPKTVANDTVELLGLQSEMPFIQRILEGTQGAEGSRKDHGLSRDVSAVPLESYWEDGGADET